MDSKTCRICQHTKPLSGFYPHPNTKDKRDTRCIACVKEVRADRLSKKELEGRRIYLLTIRVEKLEAALRELKNLLSGKEG